MMRAALVLALCLAVLSACGIKGDPVPPGRAEQATTAP